MVTYRKKREICARFGFAAGNFLGGFALASCALLPEAASAADAPAAIPTQVVVPVAVTITEPGDQPAEPPAPPARPKYIREYRVLGAHLISQREIGEAVYPFLGPMRTPADVEGARAALEKYYQGKGFQTVTVQVPPQEMRDGVVLLQVVEGKVGRLRVRGSRYFSLDDIKRKAPSLKEGTVPNFNDVTRDIVSLNQWPDLRVTPTLRAGAEPGTVDIDLVVKDTPPLHGSVELNNRSSANTVPLRVNASVSYNNLWQQGHSIGGSVQVAPERTADAKVYSAFYQMRFPHVDWISLMIQGTKQDSNVSTLGGAAVAGRGEIIGMRALINLPQGKDFYHSASFGIDYKRFQQNVVVAGVSEITPLYYYPLSASYTATWTGKKSTTDLNAGVTVHFRGMGSSVAQFENNRFGTDGNFIYFRGDLAHTQKLPGDAEIFGKVQGQIAGQPLINSEQFSGGGLGTARGYLESEVLGDSGIFGTVELRTPSLFGMVGDKRDEWRIYLFGDAGTLRVRNPLPEQVASYDLASVGIGSRMKLFNHLNGSLDAAIPLISQGLTTAHQPRLTFRVWADF